MLHQVRRARPQILVVMHDRLAPPGLIGDAIREGGGDYQSIMPAAGEGAITTDGAGHDGLVILGGVMHAGDDAGFPHFRPLLDLIRRFHDTARPVLGICLGAQLVARAFGEPVRRQGFVERGFAPVTMTDAAASDPLLAGLGPEPCLLHWHEDRVDVPAGAVHLAASAACSNQIFRVGRTSYGFQCHLEATPDIARSWIRVWIARGGPADPVSAAGFEADLARHMAGANAFGAEVARRWLSLCAKNE